MHNNVHPLDINTPPKLDPKYVLLRWPDVKLRVNICRSHAHQLIAQGKFPAPVKLGVRASAWIESEVQEWIDQRIADSRGDQK